MERDVPSTSIWVRVRDVTRRRLHVRGSVCVHNLHAIACERVSASSCVRDCSVHTSLWLPDRVGSTARPPRRFDNVRCNDASTLNVSRRGGRSMHAHACTCASALTHVQKRLNEREKQACDGSCHSMYARSKAEKDACMHMHV
eukprot:6197474-Pleurochrysis_carterae.AAC.2